MSGEAPYVTRIRRLSLDDGPGLRSVVFLKGCPLACEWCHNPENISPEQELMLFAERCDGIGDCVAACPEQALTAGRPPALDPSRCTLCGECVEACPTSAWRLAGRAYDAAKLVELLLADRTFYESSGGGVTFSGGEPTMFPDYLSAVMSALADEGIHLAIETAGVFSWPEFSTKLLPYLDLVLYDLKLADDEEHRRHTGAGNARIKRNFIRLCQRTELEVVPRTPLVPGITDTDENLAAIRRFVTGRRCRPLVLLPYNPAGQVKRAALVG